ncbi:MAG TPA: permease [Methanoregulaceae archaeon]|nr:permease [Methanoregulaceae archaeon]HQJ88374.1 permease [Methanoregulaceae archaeon]
MAGLITGSLLLGWETLLDYLSAHVITCLVPAFFIAGGIAAFLRKDAILKYFSPEADKRIAYGIASVSGTVLAVCSCTILPMFAGLLKKGAGIGPAFTFLYAGPAINILAIIYSAQVLGLDIGIARGVLAVASSIAIGLIMTRIYRQEEAVASRAKAPVPTIPCADERSNRVTLAFFGLLLAILLVGTSSFDVLIRLLVVYALSLAVAYLLIYHFSRDEVTEWGLETWFLTRKIFPILLAGTFLLGMLAYFLPPETFRPFIGTNSPLSCLIASLIGAILYMPTLLEVPIIGTTFGYTAGIMARGPALSLLLAGPTISLPSLLVIQRIVGVRKTLTYATLVVVFATIGGFLFGISGI